MNKQSPVVPLRVLFIGNSFTARNSVPDLIAQLAESRGRKLEHKLISAGGASLRRHWNKGDTQRELLRMRYDFVVLQEQSTLPIKNPLRMHENIRLFDNEIVSSGAKTVLYLTWARQDAPETQKAINTAYRSIGEELDAIVAPVGIAWQDFIRKHKHPVLHDKDRSHPTLAGSYLAASVIFPILFSENPSGISNSINGLTETEAAMLQKTAWTTVQKYQGRIANSG